MSMSMIALAVAALAVPLLPVLIYLSVFNRLVMLDQRCETAFADIDAHLKHRQNLIPPLVETVRGYATHERDILLGVAKARTEALHAATPEMRLRAEGDLTQNLTALIGMAERVPDLKASTHFQQLRQDLSDAENRVTASRRFYNLAVQEYDATLRQFPGSMIGRLKSMNPRKPFNLGVERVVIDEPIAFKF